MHQYIMHQYIKLIQFLYHKVKLFFKYQCSHGNLLSWKPKSVILNHNYWGFKIPNSRDPQKRHLSDWIYFVFLKKIKFINTAYNMSKRLNLHTSILHVEHGNTLEILVRHRMSNDYLPNFKKSPTFTLLFTWQIFHNHRFNWYHLKLISFQALMWNKLNQGLHYILYTDALISP